VRKKTTQQQSRESSWRIGIEALLKLPHKNSQILFRYRRPPPDRLLHCHPFRRRCEAKLQNLYLPTKVELRFPPPALGITRTLFLSYPLYLQTLRLLMPLLLLASRLLPRDDPWVIPLLHPALPIPRGKDRRRGAGIARKLPWWREDVLGEETCSYSSSSLLALLDTSYFRLTLALLCWHF
jgi:hypothetical protein